MEDFQDFLRAVDPVKLQEYLMDMFWKDHKLTESELFRAFIAARDYDIDLVSRWQKKIIGSDKKLRTPKKV